MHLIFDFDGTLVDSLHSAVEVYNFIAAAHHFRIINSEEVEMMKDLSSIEAVKFLKIPFYSLPSVILKARKEMNSRIPILLPFGSMPEVLEKLHLLGFAFSILSTNSEENIKAWLEHNKMEHLFSFIHCGSNFFGKAHLLKKICNRYKIDKQEAFYIGDETRDIEAAKKIGLPSIAVAWGFNSEKALSQHQPDHIARKPEDLLTICTFTTKS